MTDPQPAPAAPAKSSGDAIAVWATIALIAAVVAVIYFKRAPAETRKQDAAKATPPPVTAKFDEPEPRMFTSSSGLRFGDWVEGTGAAPKAGQVVQVHYTGWLTNGRKFDSSRDRGELFEFPLGRGRVIKGWDEGVAGMKVGGRRKLVIPPELGYGAAGAGGMIPPNATLVFEVELIGLR